MMLLLLALLGTPLTPAQTLEAIRTVDERQRSSGDYKALAYMEAKEKDKTDVVYELLVYRRQQEQKFMLLFSKPRSEQGKGYLRIDKNLWMYDPGTGKWERRTERERIGGTDTRRGDLDESRLAEEYDCAFEGEEKLGAFQVWKITLKAKEGVDVAFPVIKLWIDEASNNVLKRQELALSGRLMRTDYYPRWKKVYSESKAADVWYPEEMRFFDEVEKANSTLILVKQIDLRPLEANLFTKAWLESKSR
jgi:outer membrane lipoprotein-sorting protein